jgi:dGTPase
VVTERLKWADLLNIERPRKFLDNVESQKLSDDSRTEFERDRDRTVFSTPMRRLIGKTQVFPLDHNDHVRTRLTHSLEVSTVAEGLAIQSAREVIQVREGNGEDVNRWIAKVAETSALLHDFGNPPFGHAGELAIASWFASGKGAECVQKLGGATTQSACDFLKFEGNAQTIRIVANSRLIGHDRGLNLTCATLSAARKYLAKSVSAKKEASEHEMTKPGFFRSEEELLEKVDQRTGTAGKRNPITFLGEAADDIVYSIVDLEDGLHKNLITWQDVQSSGVAQTEIYVEVIKRLGNDLTAYRGSFREYIQAFRVTAISLMVRSVVRIFKERYDDIMMGDYHGELAHDNACSSATFITECQRLLRETVFRAPEVLRLEVRGRTVIHSLMSTFWEGIEERIAKNEPLKGTKSYAGKIYHLISSNYREQFEQRLSAKEDPLYAGLQLLTDYVCNMTDPFACRLHSELANG